MNRCTPAILPNFHAHISSQNLQPYLIPAAHPHNHSHQVPHVTGMLLFGQGKESRKLIHAHYKNLYMRRKSVDVEIEVNVPSFIPVKEGQGGEGKMKVEWKIERLTISAHAWLADAHDVEECHLDLAKAAVSCGDDINGDEETESCREWKLEEYLEGKYEAPGPMRISDDGKGDENGVEFIGREVEEDDIEGEERSMVEYEPARELEG